MKHKKRRHPRPEKPTAPANPAWERIKERFRKIDRREVAATALWFLGVFLFYTVCNYFQWTFHVILYPVALGLLGGAYLLLNGGTFSRDVTLDESRFPADWDTARREKETERFHTRRKWARKLIPPLFAVIMTLCIDMIYLNVVTA